MAKKMCEMCGKNPSTDLLFGVALCDECRAIYSDPTTLYEYVSGPTFGKTATPGAKKLFADKAKKYDPEVIRREAEEQRREEERRRRELEAEEARRKREEEEEKARRKREQEDLDAFLKENGHQGYYEYRILNIVDDRTGCVNISEISQQLNTLGRQGWHLRCAYTNELGKNATSLGVGGVSMGTNSTVDQSILILERFIRFK